KFFDVEAPIETDLAEEVRNRKRPALNRLLGGLTPACARRDTAFLVHLYSRHSEPEVLNVRHGLEHRHTLFRFIAPPATLATPLGLQSPHSQEIGDISDSIIVGGAGLIEPEGTEDIESIGIEIGQFFPLPPHALCPRLDLLRRHQGLCIAQDGAELCVAAGRPSGDEGRRPGVSVQMLEGIFSKSLPYRLGMSGTPHRQMIFAKEGLQGWRRGSNLAESEEVFKD